MNKSMRVLILISIVSFSAIACVTTYIPEKPVDFGDNEITEANSVKGSIIGYLSEDRLESAASELAFFDWYHIEIEYARDQGMILKDFVQTNPEATKSLKRRAETLKAILIDQQLETGQAIPEDVVAFYEDVIPLYDYADLVLEANSNIKKINDITEFAKSLEPLAIGLIKFSQGL